MSLTPPIIPVQKRCFVYCGDDHCNCQLSPRVLAAAQGDFLYYDHGWNARVCGEPFNSGANFNWRTGWLDCDGAPQDERRLMD